MPVKKKNGQIRVCPNFRDLNLATPKDEYVMPIVDTKVKHSVITFMDGQSSYNQIFMTTEDVHKMTFHCPRALGIYEWLVMSFELKNVGATNQRAMNLIPHDAVRKNMQVYIDDVVDRKSVV